MMTRAAIASSVTAPSAPLVKLRAKRRIGELKISQVDTPVGPLSLGTSDDGLRAAFFDARADDDFESADSGNGAADTIMREAKEQVREYFAGLRKDFTIPLAPEGTSFQKKAWAALAEIQYGKTLSYEEQANVMEERGKARAVGAANARNPICLFIPCHRVIAKGGGLCGYAFGLEIKKYLLDLESGKVPVPPSPSELSGQSL